MDFKRRDVAIMKNFYSIDWNEKENTWNVVTELIRKDYIFKGLADPNFAQKIADALNEAYNQGIIDKEEEFQQKIKSIFF